jgi:hypothetical protein
MIAKLAEILPNFNDIMHTHCFLHVVNLVAKSVTALPLDVASLHVVLWIPTTVKVGCIGIVLVKLLIIIL